MSENKMTLDDVKHGLALWGRACNDEAFDCTAWNRWMGKHGGYVLELARRALEQEDAIERLTKVIDETFGLQPVGESLDTLVSSLESLLDAQAKEMRELVDAFDPVFAAREAAAYERGKAERNAEVTLANAPTLAAEAERRRVVELERRDWAVRVLDAKVRELGGGNVYWSSNDDTCGIHNWDEHDGWHRHGRDEAEARLEAAHGLLEGLDAATRAELGECP